MILLGLSTFSIFLLQGKEFNIKNIDIKNSPYSFLFSVPIIFICTISIMSICTVNAGFWDHFTFWWVAPKKYFLTGLLPYDPTGVTYIANYSYISAVPGLLLYQAMGGVHEQLLAIYTNFYLLASFYFVISLSKNRLVQSSILIYFIYFIYPKLQYLKTYYADYLSSLMILIITYIIFVYKKKYFFEALLILLSFFLLKITNQYYVYVLIRIIVSFLIFEYKNISFDIHSKFLLILSLFCLIGYFYYQQVFSDIEVGFELLSKEFSIKDIILNFYNAIVFLGTQYFYLILFMLTVFVFFRFKFTFNYYFIFAIILIFPLINIMHYSLQGYGLESKSLVRYVSVAGLLPILFFINAKLKFHKIYFIIIILNILYIGFLLNGLYQTNIRATMLKYNSGKFVSLADQSSSLTIQKHINKKDIITLASSGGLKSIVLGNHISNVLKYHLIEYKFSEFLGVLYFQNFKEYIEKSSTNVIIVNGYNDKLLEYLDQNFQYETIKVSEDILILKLDKTK